MEELKAGWRRVRLGDVIKSISDTTKIIEDEVVLINTSDVYDGKVLNHQLVENKGLKGQFKKRFKYRDILYSEIRPINRRFAKIKFDSTNYLASTKLMILRKKENALIDEEYIYQLLKSDKIISELQQIAESRSGTFPQITFNELKTLEFFLPSLETQKKITSILSSLDEKIELNRKINQNLEEICQNYFLEIFIKNSNKNCFVFLISDLGNIVSGATPSKKNLKYYTNFGIPWITPKDLSKNFNKFISRGNLDITELGFKNSSVRLLPKGSVLFSSRAPIGYIAICSNDVTTNQGFKSIVPFKNIGTEFVYYFLKNNVQFLESRASGSTFKEISTTIMATTPAIIPKEDPLKVFKKICINIFEKQYIIEKETEKLIELRDYLLPKLMNGEIDVSNLKISEILNSDKFN